MSEHLDMRVVRELADRYSPDQLEQCLISEIETGQNACLSHINHCGGPCCDQEVVNILAKAQVVREYMDAHHAPITEAIRDLGRRIRALQEVCVG